MTFRAVVQLRRDSGKESSQAGKEGIDHRFQLMDKFTNIETSRVCFPNGEYRTE